MITPIFLSPIRRGYIQKVNVEFPEKQFQMIAVLIVFLVANEKKESDENNIKTRQW